MAHKTPFEQLSEAYTTSQTRFLQYRDTCQSFLIRVARQLEKEWGIPAMKFVELDGDKVFMPHSLAEYDYKSGLFQIAIGLTLVRERVRVRLAARQEGALFYLGVDQREPVMVGDGNPDAVRVVLDKLFIILMGDCEVDPQKIKADPRNPEKNIPGFVVRNE
jgi:hypothetical protein